MYMIMNSLDIVYYKLLFMNRLYLPLFVVFYALKALVFSQKVLGSRLFAYVRCLFNWNKLN